MKIRVLKFLADQDTAPPRRLRIDSGRPQELSRALADLKTETFRDLVEDSGVKPENQGLASLLFGRGPLEREPDEPDLMDLISKVNAGLFRQDLYFRLLGVLIRTRPFREHAQDIPLVAEKFWKKTNDPRAVAELEGYHPATQSTDAGADELNLHLAQCLRHLKRADNLIYNISAAVQPLLRSKQWKEEIAGEIKLMKSS